MKRFLCLFHGYCSDGFAAAWAVRKEFDEDCEYVACNYGDPIPAPEQLTDRNVILVDFSYPKIHMQQLLALSKSVTILDHHKTAYEEIHDLVDHGPLGGKIELSHSAAILTWEYYHPHVPMPEPLRFIQDFDLWKFDLPQTMNFVTRMEAVPYHFPAWDEILDGWATWTDEKRAAFLAEGQAIADYRENLIFARIESGIRTLRIRGYDVPAVNVPEHIATEAANVLALNAPFAIGYCDVNKGRKFSLRSRHDGGVDVSLIAQHYGGGGHEHAASFVAHFGWEDDLSTFPNRLVNSLRISFKALVKFFRSIPLF